MIHIISIDLYPFTEQLADEVNKLVLEKQRLDRLKRAYQQQQHQEQEPEEEEDDDSIGSASDNDDDTLVGDDDDCLPPH